MFDIRRVLFVGCVTKTARRIAGWNGFADGKFVQMVRIVD